MLVQMARSTLIIALVALLAISYVSASFQVDVVVYGSTSCATGSTLATTNYASGTCGTLVQGSYYSNVSCSVEGIPSGFVCASSTGCDGSSCIAVTGTAGTGSQTCQAISQQQSAGFTCITTPEYV